MITLIHGGDVVTPVVPRGVIPGGAVLVRDNQIIWVGPASDVPTRWTVEHRIDAAGRLIAPGFIDLQLNGAAGRLLNSDPTPEAVLAMSAVLPQFGCTAFLPTAITAPIERLEEAGDAVRRARATQTDGARVLGIHFEGPFINPLRAGAHHRPSIVDPSRDGLMRLWKSSGDTLRLLTLAPEMPGAAEVITAARELGIAVAIGHTEARPEQVSQAADLGATLVTHLYNAMAPLTSRDPGTVGGALVEGRLWTSIIVDGVHVHPVSVNVAIGMKASGRIVLITDGMPPIGTEETSFTLDGQTIEVRNGACYRPDGVLAGSALTMNRAVKNVNQLVGVPLQLAIEMASLNPAQVIGIADRKGSLEPGKDADVTIVDRDVEVYMTMVGGEIRYAGPGFPRN